MLVASAVFGADYDAPVFSGSTYRTLWESRALTLVRDTLDAAAVTFHLTPDRSSPLPSGCEPPVAWLRAHHERDNRISRILVSGEATIRGPIARFGAYITQDSHHYVIDIDRAYAARLPIIDLIIVIPPGTPIPMGVQDALIRSPWLVMVDDLATDANARWERAKADAAHSAVKMTEDVRFLINHAGHETMVDQTGLVAGLWADTNLTQ